MQWTHHHSSEWRAEGGPEKKEEAGSVNGVVFVWGKEKYTGYFQLGEEMKPDNIMNGNG